MEVLQLRTHQSALGYESTQTRVPSKSAYFAMNANRTFWSAMEEWGLAWLFCHRELIPEVDVVVASTQIVVELDVDDLPLEIAAVNALVAAERVEAIGGLDVQQRATEVTTTRREGNDMLAEDRDVAEIRNHFDLVEPEILRTFQEHLAPLLGAFPAVEEAAGPEAAREMYERFVRDFEREHDLEEDELVQLAADYATAVNDQYTQIALPEGGFALGFRQPYYLSHELRRSGAVAVVPGWSQAQQDRLVELERTTILPRKIYPRLVAASTLDARSRWGLLPDNQANRLMVGHHMRKQLQVGKLRKSSVDQNVALALNLFFVPHAGDLIARAQARHWQHGARWRAYDLQGATWWQRILYGGHAAATPVV